MSLDGLKTTVLPVTRAGIIFQHGIAIGKFQGVMIPATPIGWRMLIAHLSGSSDGDRLAEHPAALAGHQERDVDPFLDVAAGLGEDLAHLPGHRPGSRSLCSAMSAPKRYRISPRLGAGVRRHIGPAVSAALIAMRDIGRVPGLEAADDVARVGRVAALERRARLGVGPLPGDEVPERAAVSAGRGDRVSAVCGPSRDPLEGHGDGAAAAEAQRREPVAALAPAAARGGASRRSARRSPRSGGRARSRRR